MEGWLSSGPVGLVSGAVAGLVFGVLFEDPLKAFVRRVGRAAVGLVRGRRDIPRPGREFRLGPLHVPCQIMEGDGERAIEPRHVRVLVNPVDVQLPLELVEWRSEVLAEQERRRRSGEVNHWNGPCYAVDDLIVSRTGPREEPEITLILKYSDYHTFLTTQRLDRRFRDGSTPRSRYLDGREPCDVPDFMRTTFGLNMAVVTADGWLVLSWRSNRLGSGQGLWNSSANEGLSRDKDGAGAGPPDLFAAARRGLSEELHLPPDSYDLRLLAFTVVTSLSQWGVCFLTRLHDMSREEFEAHVSRGVEDGWEHREFALVPFRPEPVLRHLLRRDLRDLWAPTAPVLYYLALVNAYGRRAVDAAAARVLRTPS
ncbi:hypothetical protein GA0070616_5297 [Micromonospora nigra]|uniref:Nudix hydrolase domain-containing protein n=1 Tax=Micromonospora nigra TaxID=145857 RepID=A0A1C6T1Q9_9ACTN|nr:hypothetical protein GA0070616_5297 [Micromonospora nigra]